MSRRCAGEGPTATRRRDPWAPDSLWSTLRGSFASTAGAPVGGGGGAARVARVARLPVTPDRRALSLDGDGRRLGRTVMRCRFFSRDVTRGGGDFRDRRSGIGRGRHRVLGRRRGSPGVLGKIVAGQQER